MYTKRLKELLSNRGIEYYAVLSYGDVREISHDILSRSGVEPRSVIIYLLPYYSGETENVSLYAASCDYHLAISEINREVISLLSELSPGSSSFGYGDHSPIDERHAALIGGLGIAGDNGLLINEKYGSYIFIGDVVTDIEPEMLGAITPVEPARCHSCGACRRACPTGILSGEGCACLSEITQRKGELSPEEASLMIKYNTAWGCDECQRACPYNREPRTTPVEFFHRDRISRLTREMLDGMSKEEFKRRAFAWRGRRTVERNLDILDSCEISPSTEN